jgi:predicted amidophosphoribosyltransferase
MMLSARSILSVAASRARALEAFAMPRACLGCERPMPPEDPAACCALCRSRLHAIAPPRCSRCGQPLDPWRLRYGEEGGPAARGGGCGFCRAWPAELAWAASAVWLEDGPARNLVHALKYGGWRVAAPVMAERMLVAAGATLRALDVLVPVPLGRTRERERGHNQAALLAAALGRAAGLPVAAALRRRRETRSQTRLPPAERRRNLRVALVDDVLTTGATLGAAATALAALGPETIGAVTFARALVPA